MVAAAAWARRRRPQAWRQGRLRQAV
ncbi:MAG: hypothetical protein ACKOOL_12830 [Novosphingobium sp.]